VLLSDLYGTVLHTAVGAEAADPAWHARDLLADTNEPAARIVVSEYGGPAPDNLNASSAVVIPSFFSAPIRRSPYRMRATSCW
jgi:hypothetical protein